MLLPVAFYSLTEIKGKIFIFVRVTKASVPWVLSSFAGGTSNSYSCNKYILSLTYCVLQPNTTGFLSLHLLL